MMTKKSPILFLSICFLLSVSSIFGRELQIEYKSFSIDRKKNLLFYHQPRVIIDNLTITGNEMVFDKDKSLLSFTGNILVYSDNLVLTATQAVFDLEKSVNTLYGSTFYDQKNGVYGSAERIEQVEEDLYYVYGSSITPCNPEDKAWELNSSRVVYEEDNFAYATHAGIFFHSVPVFYSPLFSWPTRKGRATGFLPPELSHHSTSDETKEFGTRLKVPYFIALNRDHDLTVTADIIEKRGLAVDLNYRYAFREGMKGNIKTWYLKETLYERNPDLENLGGIADDDDLEKYPQRVQYEVNHKQRIFFQGQLLFTQAQNSDNEINKEYFESTVAQDAAFKRVMDLSFPWDGGSLSITHETESDFLYSSVFDKSTDEETHLNKQPTITARHRFASLFRTPLAIDFSGTWTKYDRKQGWEGDWSRGSFSLKYPFNIDFLRMNPSFKRDYYRYDVSYQYGPEQSENPLIEAFPSEFGWKIDTKEVGLSFELFRYFHNADSVKNGKLSIVPGLVFTEVEDVEQDVPAISGSAFGLGNYVTSRKSLTWTLDTVYLKKNLQTNSVRPFFRFNLTQIFDLNSEDCADDSSGASAYCVHNHPGSASTAETEIGEQRLPLRIKLVLNPSDLFTGSLFYRYHYNENRIIETAISLNTRFSGGSYFQISYTNNSKAYYELDNTYHPAANLYRLSQNTRLTERLDLLVSASWDQTRQDLDSSSTVERLDRQLTDFSATLSFNHTCYTLAAIYNETIREKRLDSKTVEVLDSKIGIALTIPFVPGGDKSEMGELPYRQDIDIN